MPKGGFFVTEMDLIWVNYVTQFDCLPSLLMSTDANFVPVQLGEIIDFNFIIDTDHRKRRHNRTTQFCHI